MSILLIFALQLLDCELLSLSLVEVLGLKRSHVWAELTIRWKQVFLKLLRQVDFVVGHEPGGLIVIDGPVHLSIELDVLEPGAGTLTNLNLLF